MICWSLLTWLRLVAGLIKTALVDGDIITYRCGAATDGRYYALLDEFGNEQVRYKYKADVPEGLVVVPRKEPEPLENALHSVKQMLTSIADWTNCSDLRVFLSPTGSASFRYKVDPEYKANRKDMEKPHWYTEIRDYLIQRYNAVVCDGIEADDALGIAQTDDTVICSIDKDLLMIPGLHYNFVTHEMDVISDVDGWFNFHKQLLTGDRTDNVQGIPGIGPVKAGALLECDPNHYTDVVVTAYQEAFAEDWRDRLDRTAQLIWIQREHGQTVRLQDQEIEGSITYSWGAVDIVKGE